MARLLHGTGMVRKMVTLTRLNGSVFALNPDLIERIDQTPDTVITLVDGTKYLVRENLTDVVAAVLRFRAGVLAAAGMFGSDAPTGQRTRLTAVPPRRPAPVVSLPQGEA